MPLRRLPSSIAVLLSFAVCWAPLAAKDPPPATVVPVPRDGGWMKRHESFNTRAKQGNVDLIFLGDSITQGWEGAGKEIWAKAFGMRNAMNAGISGDRTQHVIWRIDNGNLEGIAPKLAVIMIGTNNMGSDSPADIAEGVKTIVERLKTKKADIQVLLLAIFPRSPKADDPIRLKVVATNEILKTFDDGKQVHYLDIGPKFLAADGSLSKDIMPDFLHLSPAGYQIWADAIEADVAKLLK